MNNTASNTSNRLSARYLSNLHWLVIIASFILTLFAWQFSKSQVHARQMEVFEKDTENLVHLILERLELYENVLWSGVAAIKSQSFGIDFGEWQRFSSTLQIEKKISGY